MTDQSSATPIYCRTCHEQIVLPGQYVIVNGKKYHIGCETFPDWARSVRVDYIDDKGASAIDKGETQ